MQYTKQVPAKHAFDMTTINLKVLKAIVSNRHQRLKMADSEFQPLDSRNIVIGITVTGKSYATLIQEFFCGACGE